MSELIKISKVERREPDYVTPCFENMKLYVVCSLTAYIGGTKQVFDENLVLF